MSKSLAETEPVCYICEFNGRKRYYAEYFCMHCGRMFCRFHGNSYGIKGCVCHGCDIRLRRIMDNVPASKPYYNNNKEEGDE
jgi:hypothetical protein